MPVQITAKRDGFRRCGIAHSDKTVTYDDDHFSKAELEILTHEPNLVVFIVSDAQLQAKNGDGAALQADLSSAQKQLSELQAQVTTLTQQLADKTTLAGKLQPDLTAAQKQVSDLQQQLGDKTALAEKLQGDLTAAQKQVSDLQAEVASLKAPAPAGDKK